MPQFSIVIPIYNEEENIYELYNRLTLVMGKIHQNEKFNKNNKNADNVPISFQNGHSFDTYYEIILVNDGSSDRSWNIIEDLHKKDPRVKGIRFSKNFGHHIAITAGVDNSRGNFVILMDGDLQDPPEEIPKLYSKIKEGFDVVYAKREIRNDSLLKKVCSKLFHIVFHIIANVELDPNSGIFRILNRRAVSTLKRCREKSRLLVGLISWIGFSQIGIETKRDSRYAGKTKYSFFKSMELAIDGVTSFSYFPLRIATYIGFISAIISLLVATYYLVKKIFFGHLIIMGYASVIISILFIGGVQLIVIGLIGEYIGKVYKEVQNRPIYIIDESLL